MQRRGLVPASVAGEVALAAAVGRFSQNLLVGWSFVIVNGVFERAVIRDGGDHLGDVFTCCSGCYAGVVPEFSTWLVGGVNSPARWPGSDPRITLRSCLVSLLVRSFILASLIDLQCVFLSQ